MSAVEDFILNQNEFHKPLLIQSHELISSKKGVYAALKWRIPVYYYGKYFCYVNPLKNKRAIEICFPKGNELKDPKNLLSSRNRKMVKGIIISEFTSKIISDLDNLLDEAIMLNY